LLRATAARDSFAVMTGDRAAVSVALRDQLQSAADGQGLGLEVVWVGLRDIHPPVEVTPAYQDVISAEEERQAFIEQGRAYAAETLPATRQQAHRLRVTAEAAARQRTALARSSSCSTAVCNATSVRSRSWSLRSS
jgi:membrane protease subunit HflK